MPNTRTPYIVGLDLGNFSVGMTAFAIDPHGIPTDILASVSHIHDGGVGNAKTSDTHRAISGVARRARRRIRHRREQRAAVDAWLAEPTRGFPIVDYGDADIDPWEARAALVTGVIADEDRFQSLFSIAVSHMARHRGWRNPYLDVSRLHRVTEWSDNFTSMVSQARTRYPGIVLADDPTPGQLGWAVRSSDPSERMRGRSAPGTATEDTVGAVKEAKDVYSLPGILSSFKLNQSDHARELARIFEVQRIEDPAVTLDSLIDTVFHQESPKGSADERVGDDALVPGRKRVWRGDPAFQNYRIAAQLANVRVRGSGGTTRLTVDQRTHAFRMLATWTGTTPPTWAAVEDALELSPGTLRAPTDRPDDGEDLSGAPLINETHKVLWNLPPALRPLRDWYREATEDRRGSMIYHLFSNGSPASDATTEELDEKIILGLDDDGLAALDAASVPSGRGAYSAQTCRELTERIISTTDDLFDARTYLYDTPRDWAPRAADLAEATGNAAVDRSLRVVRRMLGALERRYGTPESVTVENGRDGLTTAKTAKKLDKDAKRRGTERAEQVVHVAAAFGLPAGSVPKMDQVRRYETVARQNGACFYCGSTVTPSSAELDHVVPQAGPGSTTTRDNIVAACHRCNWDKANTPAASWIARSSISGVSVEEITDRMAFWSRVGGETARELKKLTAAITRRMRQKTPDPGIDARSTQSNSWMATEIRRRLIQHYADHGADVKVLTFGGSTTAEARRTWVAGTTNEDAISVNTIIELAGGMGKQRLDRRHHALDAAVIAVMGQRASQVLAERRALRSDARLGMGQGKSADPIAGGFGKWREHTGASAENRAAFAGWCTRMVAAIDLFRQALDTNSVAVTRNQRTRLGNGATHAATIRRITRTLELRRPWSMEDIALVADPRIYTALIRQPDMDPSRGLPPNKDRELNIQGTVIGPRDEVQVMPIPGIPVRGGFAEVGDSTHHLRFYRYFDKGKPQLLRERVTTHDLLNKHIRNQDLLTVDLPESSVAHRVVPGFDQTSPGVIARRSGQAEFLGSALIGDEIHISEDDAEMLANKDAGLADLQKHTGPITSWIIKGTTGKTMQLTPAGIASEGIGLPHCEVGEESPAAKFFGKQYRPSLGILGKMTYVRVVRRNALGEVRSENREGGPLGSFTLVDRRGE